MKKDYKKEIHSLFEGWDSAFNDNSHVIESNNVKIANKSMKKKLNESEDDYIKIGNKMYPKDASGFGYDSADSISYRTTQKYNQEKEAERKEQERIQTERAIKEFADAHKGVREKLLNSISGMDSEKALELLFDELVPQSGKAETVAGEIVRAIERILYRDYNDGDKFYIGYGIETCGGSAQYLMDNTSDKISSMLYSLADNDYLSDKEYTQGLMDIADEIVRYLKNNLELFETMNTIDSRTYDDSVIKKLEPKFEYEIYYPDVILKALKDGRLGVSDLTYNLELSLEDTYPSATITTYSEYTLIDELNYDEYEDLNSGRFEENFWESIIDEYGLDDEEDDEDFNESLNKSTFENAGHTWRIFNREGSYFLIYSEDKKFQPYVVAWNLYDDGSWGQGHYFDTLEDATKFFNKVTRNVTESKNNYKSRTKMNELYRDYENPRKLEKEIRDLERKRKSLMKNGASEDILMDIEADIESLKNRANFAWQDDEYDDFYESCKNAQSKAINEDKDYSPINWSDNKVITYEEAQQLAKATKSTGAQEFLDTWDDYQFNNAKEEIGHALTVKDMKSLFNQYSNFIKTYNKEQEYFGTAEDNIAEYELQDFAYDIEDSLKLRYDEDFKISDIYIMDNILYIDVVGPDDGYVSSEYDSHSVEIKIDSNKTKNIEDFSNNYYDTVIESIYNTCHHSTKKEDDYAEEKSYSPSNPWDAPGMSASDFI